MKSFSGDGSETKFAVEVFIKPSDRLTSFERLEIYNRQYWFRLIDAFFEDYPGLRALLGKRKFLRLTLEYLDQNPSTSFSLRNVGQHLVEFIQSQPAWTLPNTLVALEMARLEWAHVEAFDSEHKPTLTVKNLLSREDADIRLHLQPHISLLRLQHPLDDFLIALRRKTGLRRETSNAVSGAPKSRIVLPVKLPSKQEVFLAVHRHQNRVFYKRLRPAQYELLSALQSGLSLEESIQTMRGKARERQIQNWFSDWTTLGWFWLSD